MNTKKTLLVVMIQLSLSAVAVAGDVEIHLPTASDAMTVDQPAGTELMRVNGDGNVGIGIAAPTSLLDIHGSGSAIITLRDGDATLNDPGHAAGIQLRDGQGNSTGFMGFGTSAEGLSIQNLNDDGGINFSTGGNNNQVVITADGNVGVGVSSPALKIDVNAGVDHVATYSGRISGANTLGNFGFVLNNIGTTPHSSILRFQNNGTNAADIAYHKSSGEFRFAAGGMSSVGGDIDMVIKDAGNVGIGTTAPSDGTVNGGQALKLDVEGAVGATHFCDENGENCQTAAGLAADNLGDHTATQDIDLAANKLVGNGGTEGVAVDADGKVGIGTQTPNTDLRVNDVDSSGYAHLQVGSGTVGGIIEVSASSGSATLGAKGASYGTLELSDTSATADLKRSILRSDDGKTHLANYTDAGVVDKYALVFDHSSGKVGVGTTTPAEALHVNAGNLLVQSSRPLLRLSDDAGVANDKNFQVQNVDGALYFGSADDNWAWDHPGDYTMVLHNNGDALFNTGKVGIGITTPASQLHVNGGNIQVNGGGIIIDDDGVDLTGIFESNNNLVLTANVSPLREDIVIENGMGHVGIGTANPTVKLHVAGPETWIDSAGGYAETRYTSATNLGDWSVGTGGSAADGFYIFDYNAPAGDRNRLYIDNSGNMRVGGLLGGPIASQLDVLGNIKVADEGFPCDAAREGQIRYEAALKKHQGCDGTSWNNLY